MINKKRLYKLISLTGILFYAVINYVQWKLQTGHSSYHPSKISTSQFEHIPHYLGFHLIYLFLVLTLVYSWFGSTKKLKQTLFIHLFVLFITCLTAVLFKNRLLLPWSGELAKVLINDILQKPIYPILVLVFFFLEEKAKQATNLS